MLNFLLLCLLCLPKALEPPGKLTVHRQLDVCLPCKQALPVPDPPAAMKKLNFKVPQSPSLQWSTQKKKLARRPVKSR